MIKCCGADRQGDQIHRCARLLQRKPLHEEGPPVGGPGKDWSTKATALQWDRLSEKLAGERLGAGGG